MEKKWYRVVDPLSPLYGCDVTGYRTAWDSDTDETLMIAITAMRRVDVFVGDRPFQLVAKDGESLGLWIDVECLDDSPVQDETVETGTDRPHGICIDESEMERGDGVKLRVARYERATQIAVESPDGELRATKTATDELRSVWEDLIVGKFQLGEDIDNLVVLLTSTTFSLS